MNSITTTQNPEWNDKRWLWLLSPTIPFAFTASILAFVLTGQWLYLLFAPAIIHIAIPILDLTFGEDFSNPPESAVENLNKDFFYRALVWLYVPFQLIGTVYGTWLAVTQSLDWYAYIALVFTVGSTNGIGIGTAHELGHKQDSIDRWLSKLALASSMYGHFFVEHNRGHHKRVATPEDPASARMGESFWVFLPRTVLGSLYSAWELERERLKRKGKGVWSIQNENLQAWSLTILLYGALMLWLGWAALIFLALQGIYAASMLEVVNYVEHYGLLRQKDQDGEYVRCAPEHSWNSNHIVGNILLYHLQRHSDHHAHPTRRYQALRHFDKAPQLPGGYASMITLAYFPPLWFALMDHRVVKHYTGDLSKINIQPSASRKLYQRWCN
ncbi:alkane 1-monooxygenase [Polynucleobacter sp. MWH-Adler-W8]|jgi:alkane 1-monooxygenase|uniref:alkane 1-monooxygenase n=1 Tax=Polynucleobacter sp. MWH-Adler-W8 TaxID=1819727 RepID=UPI00092A56D0|nr:alkane 1-monooxygenase [Polynucleobacter sp. MWH-Adler-W8]OJI05768.1 alkane 1-monooxygenase [Polynucleobacter sp. MWH-Adler-W8]